MRAGWQWEDKEIRFKLRLEHEDQELSDIEITKTVLRGVIYGVEDFMIETGEDFHDGWCPTLDMSLKIENRLNKKSTSSNITVQRRKGRKQIYKYWTIISKNWSIVGTKGNT